MPERRSAVQKAVSYLEQEESRLSSELDTLKAALKFLAKNPSGKKISGLLRRRRRLSVAARKRIADAQKARWAKWKAGRQKK